MKVDHATAILLPQQQRRQQRQQGFFCHCEGGIPLNAVASAARRAEVRPRQNSITWQRHKQIMKLALACFDSFEWPEMLLDDTRPAARVKHPIAPGGASVVAAASARAQLEAWRGSCCSSEMRCAAESSFRKTCALHSRIAGSGCRQLDTDLLAGGTGYALPVWVVRCVLPYAKAQNKLCKAAGTSRSNETRKVCHPKVASPSGLS